METGLRNFGGADFEQAMHSNLASFLQSLIKPGCARSSSSSSSSVRSEAELLQAKTESAESAAALEAFCSGNPSSQWLVLTLLLPYLDLRTLVRCEGVSKDVRHFVLSSSCLWRVLKASSPSERKLNDKTLAKLVGRSLGQVTEAHLGFCLGLTGAGIEKTLGKCTNLQKLSLRSCKHVTGSHVVGLVRNLAAQNLALGRPPALRWLRISGCMGIAAEHVRELKGLLRQAAVVVRFDCFDTTTAREAGGGGVRAAGSSVDEACVEPPFYYTTTPGSEGDRRLLDIDICPRCSRLLEVYSCTRAECARPGVHDGRSCRACIFCIERCRECGGCCEAGTWSVCGCDVCEECWFNLPKCRHCNKGWCSTHANDDDFTELMCVECKDRAVRYTMPSFRFDS